MRKVYVIIAELRMPKVPLRFQDFGMVEFAFTRKSKANKKMDEIHRMVESDELCINEGYKVIYDCIDNDSTFKRSVKVSNPDGSYMLYRLQEVVLNSGYDV